MKKNEITNEQLLKQIKALQRQAEQNRIPVPYIVPQLPQHCHHCHPHQPWQWQSHITYGPQVGVTGVVTVGGTQSLNNQLLPTTPKYS